jgi:hypothetical protein
MGGAESRLLFQKLTAQLVSDTPKVNELDEKFWISFWTLPTSIDDVFSLIKISDIQELRYKNPKNFVLLLRKSIGRLKQATLNRAKNTNEDFVQILNCVGLLTRLIPVAFENWTPEGSFEELIFWKNQIPSVTPSSPTSNPPTDEKQTTERATETLAPKSFPQTERPISSSVSTSLLSSASKTPASLSTGDTTSLSVDRPLATQLLDIIMELLFLPNFTMAISTKSPHHDTENQLPLVCAWAPGIGVSSVQPSTKGMPQNRAHVMRLLIVCLSLSLFRTPEEHRQAKFQNKWLDYLVSNENRYSRVLFYSLWNVIVTYDPIGWGVPYNHVLFSDPFEEQMSKATQLLSILWEYRSFELSDADGSQQSNPVGPPSAVTPPSSQQLQQQQQQQEPSPETPAVSPHVAEKLPYGNIFAHYVTQLKAPEEFKLLFSTICKLLNNPLVASSTYLPNSTKQVSCHPEVMMLFWHLIQLNRVRLLFISSFIFCQK